LNRKSDGHERLGQAACSRAQREAHKMSEQEAKKGRRSFSPEVGGKEKIDGVEGPHHVKKKKSTGKKRNTRKEAGKLVRSWKKEGPKRREPAGCSIRGTMLEKISEGTTLLQFGGDGTERRAGTAIKKSIKKKGRTLGGTGGHGGNCWAALFLLGGDEDKLGCISRRGKRFRNFCPSQE